MAHFGYTEVPPEEKVQRVNSVFDSVAFRYDLMNDLMSLGIHRLWKRTLMTLAQLREGQRLLDLAGGTGDLVRLARPRLGATGQATLCDINAHMLELGRDRLVDSGLSDVAIIQADAASLPFADESFDRILIGFGLRNVAQPADCLKEMHRLLKVGGMALVLEFSKPETWLAPIHHAYTHQILPKLGQLVTGTGDSYRYLAESIAMHPDQHTLREMMRAADFEGCEYFNLSAGIVAVHRGRRLA